MQVYLSVDIEGAAGIAHWDEARKTHQDYAEFRTQMGAEARAACEGALAAGATRITVKDAHGSGRNLIAGDLPPPAQLIRGWSGHPHMMVQEIDHTFEAAAFIGYHARAGAGGNPLAHTISLQVHEVRLNDVPASEYRIHAYAAASLGVPVVFVSGDRTICEEVETLQPGTRTFATKWGEGGSQQSVHPEEAIERITDGVRAAIEGDRPATPLKLPDQFSLEIEYKQHTEAYRKSFYPGAVQVGAHRVRLDSDEYFEVLRALAFLI